MKRFKTTAKQAKKQHMQWRLHGRLPSHFGAWINTRLEGWFILKFYLEKHKPMKTTIKYSKPVADMAICNQPTIGSGKSLFCKYLSTIKTENQ